MTLRQFTVSVQPASGDWWSGLAEKTWTRLAGGSGFGSAFQNGATLSSLNPNLPAVVAGTASSQGQAGHRGVIIAWCGACVNTSDLEYILAANGGHGDYWGNEVYAFKVNQAVPAWYRLTEPTPVGYTPGYLLAPSGTTSVRYADGRPRSMHTSSTQVYGNGKVWIMSQCAAAADASGGTNVWSFNRATLGVGTTPLAHNGGAGPWTDLGNPTPSLNNSGNAFGMSAYDPTRLHAWGFTGYPNGSKAIVRVDTQTSTLTTYSSAANVVNADWQSQCAVVAPDLDILVVTDQVTTNVYVMSLANPGAGFTTRSTTGLTEPGAYGGPNAWGAVYHQPSSSSLAMDPRTHTNGQVWKLKIPRAGGAVNLSVPWEWTKINKNGTVSPTHEVPSAGTYNRFNIVPDMGDGRAALMFTGGTGAGYTYIYKLPTTEIT
jgi:hypothetical protein